MAVEGTYIIKAATPVGVQEGTLIIKKEGETLSGSVHIHSQKETDTFTGGKLTGDEFEFEFKGKSPLGPAKFKYKGKVEGDKISGECVVRPRGLPLPLKSKYQGARKRD